MQEEETLLVLVHCDMHMMQSTCSSVHMHIDVSGSFQC